MEALMLLIFVAFDFALGYAVGHKAGYNKARDEMDAKK